MGLNMDLLLFKMIILPLDWSDPAHVQSGRSEFDSPGLVHMFLSEHSKSNTKLFISWRRLQAVRAPDVVTRAPQLHFLIRAKNC